MRFYAETDRGPAVLSTEGLTRVIEDKPGQLVLEWADGACLRTGEYDLQGFMDIVLYAEEVVGRVEVAEA